MKFNVAQDFTSLSELIRFYSDADEIVFKSHSRLDEQTIAYLCHDARRLAHHLHAHHDAKNATEVARRYGIAIAHESWRVAEGKVIYLAECDLQPPQIRLNDDAITSLADVMAYWANEEEQRWFTSETLMEVATTHELYHLIEQHASSPSIELAAHAFARAFTALPFSPLLYHVLLTRLAKGKGTI